MKIVMTNDERTLKFKNLDQAAAYFAFTKKAASKASAKVNIKAANSRWQTTGSTSSGIETRKTAYGYDVSVK